VISVRENVGGVGSAVAERRSRHFSHRDHGDHGERQGRDDRSQRRQARQAGCPGICIPLPSFACFAPSRESGLNHRAPVPRSATTLRVGVDWRGSAAVSQLGHCPRGPCHHAIALVLGCRQNETRASAFAGARMSGHGFRSLDRRFGSRLRGALCGHLPVDRARSAEVSLGTARKDDRPNPFSDARSREAAARNVDSSGSIDPNDCVFSGTSLRLLARLGSIGSQVELSLLLSCLARWKDLLSGTVIGAGRRTLSGPMLSVLDSADNPS